MSRRTCSCVASWTTKTNCFSFQPPSLWPCPPLCTGPLPLGRLTLGLSPRPGGSVLDHKAPQPHSGPLQNPDISPRVPLLTTSWRQCRIRCCLACSSCSRSCRCTAASSSSWLWVHRALSFAHKPQLWSSSKNACLGDEQERAKEKKVTKTHSGEGQIRSVRSHKHTESMEAQREPQGQKKSNIPRPKGERWPRGLCPGSPLTSRWILGYISPPPPSGSGGAGSEFDAPPGGGPSR